MNTIKFTLFIALIGCLMGGSAVCFAAPSGAAKQEVNDGLVTLNFRDAPIQEVFDVLSRRDKVNIILGKGVSGMVTVNLYSIPIKEAIYHVAEAAGFSVELIKGDYFIQDRKEANTEHPDSTMQLRTFKVQYSDPAQVAAILTKHLSRNGKVTPLIARKMIVIEDTAEFMARATKLLVELDAQPQQVLIEAKVLEVTLDDSEIYGVDWSKVFGSAGNTRGSFGTDGLAAGSVAGGPREAGFFFSLTNSNLNLFLEAQSTKNRVKTLATPKLLAMENQEANAVIGNKTGYKVTTTIDQVTSESIQFLESGVILRVTPSVDQQGRILLKVHPEVSSTTLSGGIPSKKSTEVTTELLCEDGQSIFIGGLIKKSNAKDRTGVPFLSDLPGIGHLFSTTMDIATNTETVVIITPRVIKDLRSTIEITDERFKQINPSDLIMDYQLKLAPSPITE